MNVHSKHSGNKHSANISHTEEKKTVAAILVFRTDIRYSKDIRAVKEILDNEPNILQWNIDRMDVDKVLRVETTCLSAADVSGLVQKAGFLCEELPD